MEGEEEKSEESGSFSKASIPKRIAIVAAGATVNIIFGIIVYFILMSCIGMYVGTEDTIINHIKFAGEETEQLFISLFDSIKQLFTGKIGCRPNDGTCWNIRSCSKNQWNTRIYIFIISNINITRSNKFITNTSFRWRKNFNTNNRSNP